MSVFRRYSQAAGAIHDLEHIAGLSAERTIPLLLSERALYVLQNLAGQDIGFECRWAVSKEDQGYQRLTTDDAEYSTFVDVVSEIGYQLSERAAGMGTLLNYREVLYVQVSTTNASAGTNSLEIQGPGADEVWVIDRVQIFNANHQNTTDSLIWQSGSNAILVHTQAAPAAGVSIVLDKVIRLSNDASLRCEFTGCTAGDDLYLRIQGYIMDLVS
jgi:hypothetical protein